VVGDPVGSDIAVFVKIQVQDAGFGSVSGNELGAKGGEELFGVLYEALREAIHSEQYSGQTFHLGVISEYTDIGSGSESGNLANELNVVSFDEDNVSLEFKRMSDGSENLLVCFLQEIFFELKYSLVIDR
jgi:hypothetical protein